MWSSDGGSSDGTRRWRQSRGARVLERAAERGATRGRRRRAHGEWLLLLHADTRLHRMAGSAAGTADRAGYFRFALDSSIPRARRLERLVAWRCRVLALPYGDQGLLIHRDVAGSWAAFARCR